MDQRTDDQLNRKDMAGGGEGSADPVEPRSSWTHPAEPDTAMPAAGETAGPPAPAPHAGTMADTEPSMPHMPEMGRTNGVAVLEPLPTPEAPVESTDPEPSESDRPRPEAATEGTVELMATTARTEYRARWGEIQTGFVDDPAQAVRQADHLVADVMEHLATTFAEERARLEERWSQGNEDTEHLRMALRRYRQFFGLLLKE